MISVFTPPTCSPITPIRVLYPRHEFIFIVLKTGKRVSEGGNKIDYIYQTISKKDQEAFAQR